MNGYPTMGISPGILEQNELPGRDLTVENDAFLTYICNEDRAISFTNLLASFPSFQLFSNPDEPVWAIGTGKVATPETAQSVHATCRSIIADMYDQEAADNMRILYGGSVTPESVDELMAMSDIDGCLVGGASLDSTKFGRIINFQS